MTRTARKARRAPAEKTAAPVQERPWMQCTSRERQLAAIANMKRLRSQIIAFDGFHLRHDNQSEFSGLARQVDAEEHTPARAALERKSGALLGI